MYQAPEIKHLERAVKAVHDGLFPQRLKEPNHDIEQDENAQEEAQEDSEE